MTVAFGPAQTPLIAGSDPFERFPKSGETSAGASISQQIHEQGPWRKLTAAVSAIASALTPTQSPQVPLTLIMRDFWEGFPSTLANVEDVGVLRLLDIESLSESEPTYNLAPRRPLPRGNAERALRAAEELGSWLGMTEEHIADISGFSRRNYSNWRAGQGSYVKTVRGLFEIHALVSGLVQELGTSKAVAWLGLPAPSGQPRRLLLATEEGRAQLSREMSKLLFAEVGREQLVADFEDDREGAALVHRTSEADALGHTPPLRRRRPG